MSATNPRAPVRRFASCAAQNVRLISHTLSVLAAVFGLLGVLVGAVATGLVSGALDRVREARRAMVAARLVQDDLTYLHATISAEIQEAAWTRLTQNSSPLPFGSWSEGRDLLASHMDFEQWNVVCIAARQAQLIVHRSPLNPHPIGTAISTGERANLETMLPDLWNGTEVLQPLTHGDNVPTFWRAMFALGA